MKNTIKLLGLLLLLVGCSLAPTKDSSLGDVSIGDSSVGSSKVHSKYSSKDKLLSQKNSQDDFRALFDTVELDHRDFKILYSKKYRVPLWVEYVALKKNLSGKVKRRENFHKDPLLERMGILPVDPKDYSRSGYDRGHMAPAGDFKYSQEALDKTFVMSNMAPQKPSLNRKSWNALEARVRRWICGEEKLTIFTGAILKEGLSKLRAGIAIPEKFFKVIYDETPPLKVIAFLYSQEDVGDPYKKRIVSLDKIEKEAGITFPKSKSMYPESEDFGPQGLSSWKSCK